ncbi:hypothetical protein QTN25_004305 [Entamoeba marina]
MEEEFNHTIIDLTKSIIEVHDDDTTCMGCDDNANVVNNNTFAGDSASNPIVLSQTRLSSLQQYSVMEINDSTDVFISNVIPPQQRDNSIQQERFSNANGQFSSSQQSISSINEQFNNSQQSNNENKDNEEENITMNKMEEEKLIDAQDKTIELNQTEYLPTIVHKTFKKIQYEPSKGDMSLHLSEMK